MNNSMTIDSMPDTLLIVEDEQLLGEELERHFRKSGWEVVWAQSCRAAREALLEECIDPLVVLCDLSLPDGNGLDLLEAMGRESCGCEWIFLTGYGDVPDSVRAMKLGAFDFLTKPCKKERLDLVLQGAARSAKAQRRLHNESAQRIRRYGPDSFIGRSPAARAVREMLAQLNRVPFSALIITGETGTGKGLAARILHHGGPRSEGPLVEVNCAALPRELLESELFGHEAGAFTGAKGRRRGLIEQAHGGTLFLDEIGEMPVDLQTKLLKVIEDRTLRRLGSEREVRVDVQVLAATNKDLQESIGEGTFRADLYHRLCVFCIELPPLRQRRDDLYDLVPLLIEEFNAKAGRKVRRVPESVWRQLCAYDWPGNVRELRNVVERCVLFALDEEFPAGWLQLGRAAAPPPVSETGRSDSLTLPLDGRMGLDEMVNRIIEAVLARHDNNVTETSRVLKTTRDKIRYRLEKFRHAGWD